MEKEYTINELILELQSVIEEIKTENDFTDKEMDRIIEDVITIAEHDENLDYG